MKAYSLDLRCRVLAAVAAGATLVAVAERFQVGVATVRRCRTCGFELALPQSVGFGPVT